MMRLTVITLVVVGLGSTPLAADVPPLKSAEPRTGSVDPAQLPPKALIRLGESRSRHWVTELSVFSPCGKYVAVDHGGAVELRDAAQGRLVLRWTDKYTDALAFSRDGTLLASGSGLHITMWKVEDGRTMRTLAWEIGVIRSLAFLPDGKRLLSGGDDGTVRLWDVTTGKLLKEKTFSEGVAVRFLGVAPDGKHCGIGLEDGRVRVWSLADWEEAGRLERFRGRPEAVAFLDNERLLIATSEDGARACEVGTGATVGWFPKTGGVTAVAPEGVLVASAEPRTSSGDVRVYHAKTEKLLATIRTAQGGLTRLVFAPDGKSLFALGDDLVPHRWDVTTGKELGRGVGHQREVTGAAFLPDGRVVSAGNDGALIFWDSAGKEVSRLLGRQGTFLQERFSGLNVSRDVTTLAVTSGPPAERTFGFIGLNYEPSFRVRVLRLPANAVAFAHEFEVGQRARSGLSPDGTHLGFDDSDRFVRVRVADGKRVANLPPEPGFRSDEALVLDGGLLLELELHSRGTSQLLCRDFGTGRRRYRLEIPRSAFLVFAGSPTPKYFAIGGAFLPVEALRRDQPIALRTPAIIRNAILQERGGRVDHFLQLRRISDGEVVRRFRGTGYPPHFVRFSSDGRLLAAADVEGVSVFESHTGRERWRFEGHDANVTCAAFSADGRRLVTGSEDSTLLVWDLTGLDRQGKFPRRNPDPIHVACCWQDLAGDRPAYARSALWEMVAAGDASVEYLSERLDLVTDEEIRRIPELVSRLDDDSFLERRAAARELERIGSPALADLKRAYDKTTSPQLRQEIDNLLARINRNEDAERDQNLRRSIYAVEILEQIGTAKARERLTRVAERGRYLAEAEDARQALERLRK
jgi:WD40 repeat protein